MTWICSSSTQCVAYHVSICFFLLSNELVAVAVAVFRLCVCSFSISSSSTHCMIDGRDSRDVLASRTITVSYSDLFYITFRAMSAIKNQFYTLIKVK